MKKMTLGLLGLALSLLCAAPVRAQNYVSRYDAYAHGVNYSLNSGGSFYGQLLSSASASSFALGFGASQSSVGTSVLSWDNKGHVDLQGNGYAPTVGTCGTGPLIDGSASDQAGDVTIGSSASGACTVTFNQAYTDIPHCFCSDRKTKVPCIAQATASTVVLADTATNPFVDSDVLDYVCIGH